MSTRGIVMPNKLIAFVSGSSGSGKNTVINRLLQDNQNYGFITSYTTRSMRPTDVDGQNYYFISKAEFEQKIKDGEMLEFDFFSENYYGLGKDAIDKKLQQCDVVMKDLTIAGVKNTKERVLDKKIVSFFLTVDKKVLIDRLVARGTSDINTRMKFYKKEQKRMFDSDYVIYNDDLEQTLTTIKCLIELELNNKYLLPTVSCQEMLEKKINKYVNKLNKNKTIKPVTIAVNSNKAYIIDGVDRYLAGLKSGKNVCKIVLNDVKVVPSKDVDFKEWNKIVKMYV